MEQASERAPLTASVCTGAFVLAASGVLAGGLGWLACAGATKMTAWILIAAYMGILLFEMRKRGLLWIGHALAVSLLSVSTALWWMRSHSVPALGGIETDLDGRALAPGGEPVAGLYAAGEASGFGGGGDLVARIVRQHHRALLLGGGVGHDFDLVN